MTMMFDEACAYKTGLCCSFSCYGHDCLIEKGMFEATIPLSDIYYEE